MILTYSKDQFVAQIKAGTKIHTIRTDKPRRWRPNLKIQHWRGNPRFTNRNPFHFKDDVCKSVQDIIITRADETDLFPEQLDVRVSDPATDSWHFLTSEQIAELAQNDGLTLKQFRLWFVPPNNPIFEGRIIHWTDKTY